MAFKWRSDKKKRKDDSAVFYGEEFEAQNQALGEETSPAEEPQESSSVYAEKAPGPEAPAAEKVAEGSPISDEILPVEESPIEEEGALPAEEEALPVEMPSEDLPSEGEVETAPEEAETVLSADPEEPVLSPQSAEESNEAPSESAEAAFDEVAPVVEAGELPSEDKRAEESVSESAEEAPSEAPRETATEPVVEEAKEEGAEGESNFVMDDEYMKAFMEEGALDDYVYGGNFEERQDLLDKIADNAETLAEEGTELLEKQEQEKQEAKKQEPKYNEKGELLNENGKAVLKRTFENKLILADTRERRYYNKLKNEILSYEGVKAEMQTATEVFRRGKQVVARLAIAGFTRVYFALDPSEFDTDRYKQEDRSEVDFEDARMMLRVRNDDEFAIAVELLQLMMGALNVKLIENRPQEDYLPAFPRREDAVLDKKGKYLSLEEKDEQALIKEKRAEERKAAGLSEEPVEEVQEEEVKDEPLTVLPLTLENKIHQSPNTIKLLYSKLKNEMLSYKTVKADLTIKNENFRAGKKMIARMTIVADNVRLYLALDPKKYSTRKYKHRDASDQQGYEGTHLMLKISGEKDREIAVKLITELMKDNNLERNKRYAYVPFAEKYPYIKNAVFKGEEDKPYVKHEGEEYADIYGELTEHLREQMGATDAWGVPKGYTPDDGLTARDLLELQRSKAKTLNAGVALATPIVFFYDAAIDEEGKVQYLNVQQVLNDKFLGKMIPQEYFAIAESSSRIEELNFIALDNVVKDCNENPDIRFVVKISCRLLLKQETLTKLVDKMHTEHGNLILAFDCAMLEAVGYVGISAINTLKTQGALIMIDNAESASMRVLTEYEFDYLRLDARYYGGDSSKRLAHLDMITGYAAVQNIITTSINCEHKEEARILLDHGVKVIQGDAVARPMRLINLALTNIKPVPKPKVKDHGEK